MLGGVVTALAAVMRYQSKVMLYGVVCTGLSSVMGLLRSADFRQGWQWLSADLVFGLLLGILYYHLCETRSPAFRRAIVFAGFGLLLAVSVVAPPIGGWLRGEAAFGMTSVAVHALVFTLGAFLMTLFHRIAHVKEIRTLAFSPDGRLLLRSGEAGTAVQCVDDPAKTTWFPGKQAAGFTPDSQMVATLTFDDVVRFWNITERREQCCLTGARHAECLALSPDGRLAAAGCINLKAGVGSRIVIWDVHRRAKMHAIAEATMEVRVLALSNRWLAAAGTEHALRVWDTTTWRLVHEYQGLGNEVLCVTFSVNGQMLAAGDNRGQAKIWEMASGREMFSLPPHVNSDREITALAFTNDAARLAFACDSVITLWNIAAASLLAKLPNGHEGPIHSLTFSPDDRQLVSGGRDGDVVVWDVERGAERARHQ